jgi:hypothetical protein
MKSYSLLKDILSDFHTRCHDIDYDELIQGRKHWGAWCTYSADKDGNNLSVLIDIYQGMELTGTTIEMTAIPKESPIFLFTNKLGINIIDSKASICSEYFSGIENQRLVISSLPLSLRKYIVGTHLLDLLHIAKHDMRYGRGLERKRARNQYYSTRLMLDILS